MNLKNEDLVFISRIHKDGTGVTLLSEEESNKIANNSMYSFQFIRMSISHGTYLAVGDGSFIVKLKS